MSVKNWILEDTFEAGENLQTSQFRAVALDDGKVANNGGEASGVLLNKPQSGESGTLCIIGISQFIAGGAISKGDGIAVTTSGYFITAASGYFTIGRARAAVTSGSIGTGLFNFNNPIYAETTDFVW